MDEEVVLVRFILSTQSVILDITRSYVRDTLKKLCFPSASRDSQRHKNFYLLSILAQTLLPKRKDEVRPRIRRYVSNQ